MGGSGAQECLRDYCRSHWGAVIQKRHTRERKCLEVSVGAGQPTVRVDMAQSESIRSQGALGGTPCTKPEELLLHFLGVAFLTSPSLCFIRGHTCRALAEPFRVLAVGVLGQHLQTHGRLVPKGNHSPPCPGTGHWHHCLFSFLSLAWRTAMPLLM